MTGDIFGSYTLSDHETTVSRLLAPIDPRDVRTIRGIGLNYKSHAEELRTPFPSHPVVFHKPSTAIIGHNDTIQIPGHCNKCDYEAEIVVVIGRRGKDIREDEALDHILGYTLGNDVSHRDWQMELGGSQWSYSKGFDTSAPIGPVIVTTHQDFEIESRVNGEVRQKGTTKDLIFGVKKLVAFLSQGTTLMPGDLIFTGTPAGVGVGFKPPRFLKGGDEVIISSPAIGELRNQVGSDAKAKL